MIAFRKGHSEIRDFGRQLKEMIRKEALSGTTGNIIRSIRREDRIIDLYKHTAGIAPNAGMAKKAAAYAYKACIEKGRIAHMALLNDVESTTYINYFVSSEYYLKAAGIVNGFLGRNKTLYAARASFDALSTYAQALGGGDMRKTLETYEDIHGIAKEFGLKKEGHVISAMISGLSYSFARYLTKNGLHMEA